MSDYMVTAEETRRLAEMFAEAHPHLRSRWGFHFGDAKWPVFDDEPEAEETRTPEAKWLLQLVDPTGLELTMNHDVVLSGLRRAQYEDSSIEADVISGWMTMGAAERTAGNLPDWFVSRICQLGLFKDGKKFPYGGESFGSSWEKSRSFAAEILAGKDEAAADA
ncbi:hypothetical protein [Streptomyces sp. NPDC018055]|uniref:hypothetical protein n=1 Tax=Streptomyces sp. NPDC018055 TaxID=3365038 RepID=UPI00379C35C4